MQWSSIHPVLRIIIASITAFFTTLAAASAAWPIIEPFVVAHRQYVREYTDAEAEKLRKMIAPTQAGIYDVQLGIARSRRSAVNDRVITLEIEAPKSDSAEELIKRRQQLEALKDERDTLDEDIKRLRAQRDKP